jgi:uncharacterized membrane protein
MTTHVTPQPSPSLEAPATGPGAAPGAPDTVAGASSRTRARWSRWFGLAAVGVVAVLVFWVFDALPFQDLPAHAGLIAMRHRFAESTFEQRFFVLAPHIGPYSLFRFLGEGFVRIVGAVGAVRALATLPVIATPLALLFARRRLYGDTSPTYGFVGLALSFSLMTLLGFASYLLGVAVMLVGLTLWLDLLVAADDRSPDVHKRELVIAAFAPLMFVAHGHAFVLFLATAGISCIATGNRFARLLRLRALVPAIALAGWVAWLERGSTTPPRSVPVVPPLQPIFHDVSEKLGLLVTPTLMTRTGIDFLAGVIVWVFAIASAVLTVRSLRAARAAAAATTNGDAASAGWAALPRDVRHSQALYACAVTVGVIFLALPHAVGWFGFVDGRLVPLVLFFLFLGLRKEALPRSFVRAFETGAPLVAATIAALAMVASYRFQAEAAGFHEVLGRIPAGARLLNLPLDPNSDVFTAHPFVHYDKLVLAERPIVVSDVWFHQGSALYPTAENPALNLPTSYSESDLKEIDWPSYRLDDWDFVLIRTRPQAPAPRTPDALHLEEHRGGWWLFRHSSTSASFTGK